MFLPVGFGVEGLGFRAVGCRGLGSQGRDQEAEARGPTGVGFVGFGAFSGFRVWGLRARGFSGQQGLRICVWGLPIIHFNYVIFLGRGQGVLLFLLVVSGVFLFSLLRLSIYESLRAEQVATLEF